MEIPIRYVGSTIKNHLEVFDYQFKKSCTVEGLIRAHLGNYFATFHIIYNFISCRAGVII